MDIRTSLLSIVESKILSDGDYYDRSVTDNVTMASDPKSIYLYTFRFTEEADIQSDTYIYYEQKADGTYQSLKKYQVPAVINSAYEQGLGNRMQSVIDSRNTVFLTKIGTNLETPTDAAGMKHWKRVSYFAYVLEHKKWSFSPGTGKTPPPFTFETDIGGGKKANNAFRNATPFIVSRHNLTDFNGCFCINTLKNKDGIELKEGEVEEYKYSINTLFDFGHNSDPVLVIFDPGGNNLGPPDPP